MFGPLAMLVVAMELRIVGPLGNQVDKGIICWDKEYMKAGLGWEDEYSFGCWVWDACKTPR